MRQYFDVNWSGPAFELFGAGHLIYLAMIAAVLAFLVWGWRDPGERAKRRTRLLIASIMLANEIAWHAWNIAYGVWSIQVNLPLHLCGLAIWSTIYILLSRDQRLYQFIFFIALAGASQAVITPSAGEYGLPHFRAFQTLISHGMVVIAIVYLTAIEGFRPTWASVWKTMLFLNVYLAFVATINVLIGSNYLFTIRKPETTSLFDVMGPWPWYLATAEILAVILFSLLYLPFAIADRRLARRQNECNAGNKAGPSKRGLYTG